MPVRGRGAFPASKDATTFREHSQTITEYRALKKLDKSAQALELLRRVGQAVRPIMLKHKWRLPLLVEMYPKTDNLLGLNVNRGQKIALRLRRPFDQNAFIDEESVIETMLHELAHNIRGPHDEVFFHHLDILTQEWYDVRAGRHLPGQGFAQPGHILGAGGSGSGTIGMSRPGRTLGGSARINTDVGRKEAAANAAERRRRIVAGCPSNDSDATMQASQEQEQQERLHGVEVIVLDDDDDVGSGSSPLRRNDTPIYYTIDDDDSDDEDDVVVVGIKKSALERDPPPLVHMADSRRDAQLDPSASDAGPSHESSASRQWTCQACTLSNALHAIECIACETVRPGVPHWTCRQCKHKMLGGFADLWCCSQCGVVKIA